jgi:thiol-disulfide isomerase/thioredoxin
MTRQSLHFTMLVLGVTASFACSLITPGVPNETAADRPPAELAVDISPAPESFALVTPHPSEGALQDLLTAHALRAIQAGRKPFVEFSADWCPPCVALARSLGDPRMVDAFQGTYIIRLDFDEWESRLPGSGFRVVGVPVFFEINAEGKPTGRMITGAAWGADIPENMAPVLQAFFRGSASP